MKCLSLIRLSIETSPWNEYFINDKLSVLFWCYLLKKLQICLEHTAIQILKSIFYHIYPQLKSVSILLFQITKSMNLLYSSLHWDTENCCCHLSQCGLERSSEQYKYTHRCYRWPRFEEEPLYDESPVCLLEILTLHRMLC